MRGGMWNETTNIYWERARVAHFRYDDDERQLTRHRNESTKKSRCYDNMSCCFGTTRRKEQLNIYKQSTYLFKPSKVAAFIVKVLSELVPLCEKAEEIFLLKIKINHENMTIDYSIYVACLIFNIVEI